MTAAHSTSFRTDCSISGLALSPAVAGLLFLSFLSIISFLSLPVSATTLVGMAIDEVAAEAELVFEGEVIEHNVRREAASGLIHTYVTFNVLDVIKGVSPGATLELRFTGGQFNGQIVEISGSSIPAAGEHGIYFVESTSENLLNPLLGWSQGHYLIVEEDGQQQMRTNSRQPVMEIQSAANVPMLIRRPKQLKSGSGDTASGVVTDRSPLSIQSIQSQQPQQQPLSADEFKARIRAMISQ